MIALRSRTSAVANHAYALRRTLATHAKLPQTYIEKVVQRHSVGLPEGKVVRAGDYVMIKPQHVMTHVRPSPGPETASWSMRLTCCLFPSRLCRGTGQHGSRHFQVGLLPCTLRHTREWRLTPDTYPQVLLDRRHQDLEPASNSLHSRPRRPEPESRQPRQVCQDRGLCEQARGRLLPRRARHRSPNHDRRRICVPRGHDGRE